MSHPYFPLQLSHCLSTSVWAIHFTSSLVYHNHRLCGVEWQNVYAYSRMVSRDFSWQGGQDRSRCRIQSPDTPGVGGPHRFARQNPNLGVPKSPTQYLHKRRDTKQNKTNKQKSKPNSYRIANSVPGPPVEVGVTMYVLSISSVSEVLMVHRTVSNYLHKYYSSITLTAQTPPDIAKNC